MEWHAMVLLGAFHGINPGMGWLFAVALGMQAGSARGVWRALPPIALGHALAVGPILVLAVVAQRMIPPAVLSASIAVSLCSIGGYRLWRHRHPRYAGMCVGFRDLTIWSFLMASAHGAGFMLLPFVISMPADAVAAGHTHMAHHAAAAAPFSGGALAIHTAAYFATMALAAYLVYTKFGLMLLRRAWINLDWLWAAALVATGLAVLVK